MIHFKYRYFITNHHLGNFKNISITYSNIKQLSLNML